MINSNPRRGKFVRREKPCTALPETITNEKARHKAGSEITLNDFST